MLHRLAFMAVLCIAPLQGEEALQQQKVIDTIDHVVLSEIPHLDPEGHLIGQAYFVHNNNPYPVYIKIRITKAKNVKNDLVTMTKMVMPNQQIGLGDVWKNNTTDATWDYDWVISRNPL